jgi:hypothetical protein
MVFPVGLVVALDGPLIQPRREEREHPGKVSTAGQVSLISHLLLVVVAAVVVVALLDRMRRQPEEKVATVASERSSISTARWNIMAAVAVAMG